MSKNLLGKKTKYIFNYTPSLLFPIPRRIGREYHKIDSSLFHGCDVWNAYELSWLNSSGKPEVRILKIGYPCDSEFIVESKSFKLYLNSYIMTQFDSENEVLENIKNDMEKILRTRLLFIKMYNYSSEAFIPTKINAELLIDDIDIRVDNYEVNRKLLALKDSDGSTVERFSNLLKTNCPVTGQPDWATVRIRYKARKHLEDSSLLKYIISYRNHSGYHETCCEQIFSDIHETLDPEILDVMCFFTRRGGIDINPIRTKNMNFPLEEFHYFRQ